MHSTERVRKHVIFRAGNCIWFIGEAKLFEPRLERFEVLISEGSEDNASGRFNADSGHHSEQQPGEKPVIKLAERRPGGRSVAYGAPLNIIR